MKIAFFAFKGDPLCFIHVLLNALDIQARGGEAKIIFEGEATRLIAALKGDKPPWIGLFIEAKSKGLMEGACRACSTKMGVLMEVEDAGIPFLDEMSGHPGMARYLDQGFQIITM
ncbi:MAG: cytoplasmic protein [Desulfobacterota bacterium]|jgi:hypothetical protein|nr:cytoplasmic protein [Thermodesulfobacteriota bacterium]